jgi:hypothetical protein
VLKDRGHQIGLRVVGQGCSCTPCKGWRGWRQFVWGRGPWPWPEGIGQQRQKQTSWRRVASMGWEAVCLRDPYMAELASSFATSARAAAVLFACVPAQWCAD